MKAQRNALHDDLTSNSLTFPLSPPTLQLSTRNELFNRVESGVHKTKEVVCSINFLLPVFFLLGSAAMESLSVFLGALVLSQMKKEYVQTKRLTHSLGWEVGALSGMQISLFYYATSACAYYLGCKKRGFHVQIALTALFSLISLPIASVILGHPELMSASLESGSIGFGILCGFSSFLLCTITLVSCCCAKTGVSLKGEKDPRLQEKVLNELNFNAERLKPEKKHTDPASFSVFFTKKNPRRKTKADTDQITVENESEEEKDSSQVNLLLDN